MGIHGQKNQTNLAIGLSLLFALMAALAIAATRSSQGIAVIWPANACLATAMLLLRPRIGLVCALACGVMTTLINLAFSTPLPQSLVFAAINVGEAVGTAWLASRLCPGLPRISYSVMIRMMAVAIIPATLTASLVGASVFAFAFGGDFAGSLMDWATGDVLGMAIFLPIILLLIAGSSRSQPLRESWRDTTFFAVLFSAIAFAPHDGLRIAGMFTALALMTGLAFRGGPKAVAAATVIGAAILTAALTRSPESVINPGWSLGFRILMAQIYVAILFFTGMITALAIADQRRLKMLYARRTASARQARRLAEIGQPRQERISGHHEP